MHFSRISREVKGSLTLEAAVVLPLFLMAMIAISLLIECNRLEAIMTQVLYDKGTVVASYAYPITKGEESIDLDIELSEVTEFVKEAYLTNEVRKSINEYPILKEITSGSVFVIGSRILKGNGDIRINLEYDINIPIALFKIKPIHKSKTIFMHGWVGYEGNPAGGTEEDDDVYVYISSTSTVYHTTPECTHLDLSTYTITGSMIADERNEYGGKFHACEKCCHTPVSATGIYIVSRTGDRYHTDLMCSGLKRDVKRVKLSSLHGMGACSRCGN